MGKRFQLLLIPVLITVLVNVMLNNTVNRHMHSLQDGEILVHAHPFQHSPGDGAETEHQHTGKEYVFFQMIFYIFSLAIIVLLLIVLVLNQLKEYFAHYLNLSHPGFFDPLYWLRGPPVQ